TTDPLTSPPPSTRSSSEEPLGWRGVSSVETSARVFTCAASPAQWLLRPALLPPTGVVSITVSTSVCQAWHSAHWPAHLLKVAPHSVQPERRLFFASVGPGAASPALTIPVAIE